jgi:hypothetical protein
MPFGTGLNLKPLQYDIHLSTIEVHFPTRVMVPDDDSDSCLHIGQKHQQNESLTLLGETIRR